jgi:hypothetical protein
VCLCGFLGWFLFLVCLCGFLGWFLFLVCLCGFLGWFLLCSVFIAHSNIQIAILLIITGKKFSSFFE